MHLQQRVVEVGKKKLRHHQLTSTSVTHVFNYWDQKIKKFKTKPKSPNQNKKLRHQHLTSTLPTKSHTCFQLLG